MNQPDPTQLLDQDYLRNNFHDVGFSYLLPELLELFSKQTGECLQALEQHYLNNNLAAMGMEAHTLKGTAASVGAAALSIAAADLEHAAQEPDAARIVQAHNHLQELATKTLQAVTDELKHLTQENELDVL